MAEKLKPMGFYLGQLDSADYDGRGAMMKAARKLRAAHKAKIDADKKDERDFKNRQLSMGEKRGMVTAGTHRWCSGFGGCGGKGYLVGKDGVMLKHQPCRGDGLIRVRSGGGPKTSTGPRNPLRQRGRRRWRSSGRRGSVTRRTAVYAAGCSTFVGGAGAWFGTIGQIVAIVLVVVFTLLKLVGAVARLSGAVLK